MSSMPPLQIREERRVSQLRICLDVLNSIKAAHVLDTEDYPARIRL